MKLVGREPPLTYNRPKNMAETTKKMPIAICGAGIRSTGPIPLFKESTDSLANQTEAAGRHGATSETCDTKGESTPGNAGGYFDLFSNQGSNLD
jgi:hypothetical protein